MSPTEFVIRRSVWLRGEGPMNSMLLRPSDGKQCCVGIYLSACGVPNEALEHRPNATSVTTVKDLIPTWLLVSSITVNWLYRRNDAPYLHDGDREAGIQHLFAEAGVKVTFVD
jgi:hypothetical protein